jgi:putative transposase
MDVPYYFYFLVQSVPKYCPTKIITIIKSITAKEILKRHPDVKKALWGGEFWSDGYFVSSVGKHGNEDTIREYVKKQGMPNNQYKRLLKQQLTLF